MAMKVDRIDSVHLQQKYAWIFVFSIYIDMAHDYVIIVPKIDIFSKQR